ncbi:MAG: DegV family protein [Lachnospiraceae bacterium]|nr:DegV family protein [Lachnospiraceae bacterium]
MSVGVVTDTNSGVLPEEARELGLWALPMPFTIGDKEYLEGVDLSHERYYELMESREDIRTSQPSPGSITDLWDEVLKERDELIYIPMSSGLSGTCQTATMLAEDYDGRVQVVDNQRISVTQRRSALDALALAGQGRNAKEIKEILEREKFASSIYITLNTLYYLKKGGRITPAAAALGTVLRIKPVLTIQGQKLDAFAKARTMAGARQTMLSAMKNDLEKRFNGDVKSLYFYIAHTKNAEAAEDFSKEVREAFGIEDVRIEPLSLSIATHIGPGSLAIAVSSVVPELKKT